MEQQILSAIPADRFITDSELQEQLTGRELDPTLPADLPLYIQIGQSLFTLRHSGRIITQATGQTAQYSRKEF